MKYMFRGCSSLSSLPDISKWNAISKNKISMMLPGNDIEFLFEQCGNLILPKEILKKFPERNILLDPNFFDFHSEWL